MKAMNIISTLYKSYVLKNAFRDVAGFVKDNFDDIEWDKDYWLHKVGLSTYQPVSRSFGGLGLFLLGLAAGGVAALAFAPQRGDELRAQVKDKMGDLVNKAQMAADKISSEIPARV
jgi:hypothetical protein